MIDAKKHLNKILTGIIYLIFPTLILYGLTNWEWENLQLALYDLSLSPSPFQFFSILIAYLLLNDLLIFLAHYLKKNSSYGKGIAGLFMMTTAFANLVFIFFFMILIMNNENLDLPNRYYSIPIAFFLHEIYALYRYLKS